MSATTPVHLVGSLAFRNEVDVFEALASELVTRAKRYPDGETGERDTWIRWQRKVFESNPNLEIAEGEESYRKNTPLKLYRAKSGISPGALTFPTLGYADAAIESYDTFRLMKERGKIPHGVRFLVALPTPVAVITSFIAPDQRDAVEPIYERELLRELRQIIARIPAK